MVQKVFIILVLAAGLSGCAGGAAPSTDLSMDASDFAFGPAAITVPAGQPVTLTIENTGKVEHDFVVEQIAVSGVEAVSSGPAQHHSMGHTDYDLHVTAGAGQTATLTFTPQEPGTYRFFCSIEGHQEAGMIGEMTVVAVE